MKSHGGLTFYARQLSLPCIQTSVYLSDLLFALCCTTIANPSLFTWAEPSFRWVCAEHEVSTKMSILLTQHETLFCMCPTPCCHSYPNISGRIGKRQDFGNSMLEMVTGPLMPVFPYFNCNPIGDGLWSQRRKVNQLTDSQHIDTRTCGVPCRVFLYSNVLLRLPGELPINHRLHLSPIINSHVRALIRPILLVLGSKRKYMFCK